MKKPNKLNFFRANYQAINNDLSNIDWTQLMDQLDIDSAVDVFYRTLKPIIHKHTPKSLPRTDKFPIWFSKHLIQLIKEKEAYFKLKNQTNNSLHIALFKIKRREIKHEKKKCIELYEANIEEKIKSNPKAFFSYTKSLQKSNCLTLVMRYKERTSENMKETADLFANCFANVYTAPNCTFQPQCNNNCKNYFPITENEIHSIIISLDQNKIHSPDEIPTIFYRSTLPNISKPLMKLFELRTRANEISEHMENQSPDPNS